jgi:hypothetical protein
MAVGKLWSWLRENADAAQAVLALMGVFTTAFVAYKAIEVAERQADLMAIQQLPAISVQQYRVSGADPLARVGPIAVQNSNASGPARNIQIQFVTFLRVEYVDEAEIPKSTPAPFIQLPPPTQFVEIPIDVLYIAETSQTEIGTLMQLFPAATDTAERLGRAESDLSAALAEAGHSYRVTALNGEVFLNISYSDFEGTDYSESFRISGPPLGVSRIPHQVWAGHEFMWRSIGRRFYDVGDLTASTLMEAFLSRRHDPGTGWDLFLPDG